MSKVKIVEHKRIEKESNLEYPIYLYFQDELDMDELVMVTDKVQISVKYSISGFKVEVSNNYGIEEHYLDKLTTKYHFEDVYREAVANLNQLVNI